MSMKKDSSQWDMAIKGNDRRWAEVATEEILTVFKEKCSEPRALELLHREAG